MKKKIVAVLILLMLLSLFVNCSGFRERPPVVSRVTPGVVLLEEGDSAPFTGYLLAPETLERVLIQATESD